jgi:hypothetical protein
MFLFTFSSKKIISLVLGSFFALGLFACSGQNSPQSEPGGGIGQNTTLSEGTDSQAESSEIRVEKVLVQDKSCSNGMQDSGETDVDCGGSCETKCEPFKLCASVADCQTSFSYAGKSYTGIRCDDKVASFDPEDPAILGKKMCINEQLFWEAIQVAVARATPPTNAVAPASDVKYLVMREGKPSLAWDSTYSRAHCPSDATIYEGSNDSRGSVMIPNIDLAHQDFSCVIKFSEPYSRPPVCVITGTGFATPVKMTFKIHSVTAEFVEVKGQTNGGSGATLAFNYFCL